MILDCLHHRLSPDLLSSNDDDITHTLLHFRHRPSTLTLVIVIMIFRFNKSTATICQFISNSLAKLVI